MMTDLVRQIGLVLFSVTQETTSGFMVLYTTQHGNSQGATDRITLPELKFAGIGF